MRKLDLVVPTEAPFRDARRLWVVLVQLRRRRSLSGGSKARTEASSSPGLLPTMNR